MQPFDPRPVRTAAVQALLFLAGPGSFEGAQLLAARAGVAPLAPMLPASTHAVLQLVGGFLTLIFAFLAHGVPHLLGLDLGRSARARWAIRAIGALLLVDVAGELAASCAVVLCSRALLVAAAVAYLALLAAARLPRHHDLWRAPAPILLVALACVPIGLALWTWEATGGPSGLASDLLLFGAVVPVILSMGFQMFASLLQLDEPSDTVFFVALVAWLGGAALRVLARAVPAAGGLHAPLFVVGAVTWIVALRGLRKRRGGPVLRTRPSPDLVASVLVAASALIIGGTLGAWPRLGGPPLADDLARHVIALGFVLVVTMAVTLRVLPQFCRGRPSSVVLGLATLGAIVIALLLRAGELLEHAQTAVALSALVSWVAVIVWALHLGRGLLPPAQRDAALAR